jgi:quinol monooxygenase YgiN
MATILAHLAVKPGCEARFEQIAAALYEATHGHETHVRRYEYWRGSEPGTYYTLLAFDDYDGFLEHQTSEHHESVARALGEVLASLRLEWVDPVQGAAPLPPSVPTPPRPDASEVWRRYAERFALQEADWWLPLRQATGGATTAP